jgi:hypothetical protein
MIGFPRPFRFCDDFGIRGARHSDIACMAANMTALFQWRGHVAVHVHVKQKVHPATAPGMGRTRSSIAHEAYASA